MTLTVFFLLISTFIIELFFYNFALSMRWKKGLKKFDAKFESINALEGFDYKLGSGHIYQNNDNL